MPKRKFTPYVAPLTHDQIAYYTAKGRQARSDAIVGGLVRGIKALRGRFERDGRSSVDAYRLTWKAR